MATVFCTLCQQELKALAYPPFPGALGKRIQLEISQKGWEQWLEVQTKMINEHRLNPMNPKDKALLKARMCAFLFDEGDS